MDLHQAAAHLAAADPALGAWIERCGGCALRPRRVDSLFAPLARAIVYQQLSGRAAATIHRRFCRLFPRARPTASGLLRLERRQLREAGLSDNKTRALYDLAERVRARRLPAAGRLHEIDDGELVARLTEVRGIGVWTVQMLMIFDLGRPDVLPLADLGIRKGMRRLDGLAELPGAEWMTQRAQSWRPWRSVASWYLWRLAEAA